MCQTLSVNFTVVCDWANKKRACAADDRETAFLSGTVEPDDVGKFEEFKNDSKKDFEKRGWYIGENFQLCPNHNTAANRKKKSFPLPQPGSVADEMRQMRSS